MVLDKEDFNTCVAKCLVTNEHCIGVLKSWWHSLKEIRVQFNQKKDSCVLMVRWVALCGKLHNYVMSQNDEWTVDDEEITSNNPEFSYEGNNGYLVIGSLKMPNLHLLLLLLQDNLCLLMSVTSLTCQCLPMFMTKYLVDRQLVTSRYKC